MASADLSDLSRLNNRAPQILPETAHEVQAILHFTINGQTNILGNINDDVRRLPNVMVRLGTKVSYSHPSSVGFRVFLRSDCFKANSTGSLEDFYHIVSCKFNPKENTPITAVATGQDKLELYQSRPWKSFENSIRVPVNYHLRRLDFSVRDTQDFTVSRHGVDLRTKNGHIKQVEKLLPFVSYASKISLFFPADGLLTSHLDLAIEHDGIGETGPSWNESLPDSSVVSWPSNIQTQMVAGSVDILNVLKRALREPDLKNGAGTSVNARQQAVQFKLFVQKTYPSLRIEPNDKVYPVMLNVAGGVCMELPFGASMFNRMNTYAGINALHNLLRFGISASDTAIVTIYPTQVQAYERAMKTCHEHDSAAGYANVKVGLVEHFIGKVAGIVILDLVRTANSSGNLGLLSQARRLQALLSVHRDGLMIIGSRDCTTTSQGSVSSMKLEKLLQWLEDKGRVVEISNYNMPQQRPDNTATESIRSSVLSHRRRRSAVTLVPSQTDQIAGLANPESISGRLSFGSPRSENLDIDKVNYRLPDFSRDTTGSTSPVKDSFVRQGFLAADHVAPPNYTSKENFKTLVRESASAEHDEEAATADFNTNCKRRAGEAKESDDELPNALSQSTLTEHPERPQDLNTDSSADHWTNRFKLEFEKPATLKGNNVENYTSQVLKENICEPSPSKLACTPPVSNSVASPPTTAAVSSKESRAAQGVNGSVPPHLRVKAETISSKYSPQKPTTKLPTHSRSAMPSPIDNQPRVPSLNGSDDMNASASTTSPAQNYDPRLRPSSNVPSVRDLDVNVAKPEIEFKAQHFPRYQAIRAIFESLHGTIKPYPDEDLLFRLLSEAFIDENEIAFNSLYASLLDMAKGMQMGASGQWSSRKMN